MREKIIEISRRRHALLVNLVPPARAALAQMQDAGMKHGAAPLGEALFQIDAIEGEMEALIGSDPERFGKEVVEWLKEK